MLDERALMDYEGYPPDPEEEYEYIDLADLGPSIPINFNVRSIPLDTISLGTITHDVMTNTYKQWDGERWNVINVKWTDGEGITRVFHKGEWVIK